MSRERVATLLTQGEVLEKAGRLDKAKQIADELLRIILVAPSMRQDGSNAVRKADTDAIAWARSVIEKYDLLKSAA
jgi:hypothetical protein